MKKLETAGTIQSSFDYTKPGSLKVVSVLGFPVGQDPRGLQVHRSKVHEGGPISSFRNVQMGACTPEWGIA